MICVDLDSRDIALELMQMWVFWKRVKINREKLVLIKKKQCR